MPKRSTSSLAIWTKSAARCRFQAARKYAFLRSALIVFVGFASQPFALQLICAGHAIDRSDLAELVDETKMAIGDELNELFLFIESSQAELLTAPHESNKPATAPAASVGGASAAASARMEEKIDKIFDAQAMFSSWLFELSASGGAAPAAAPVVVAPVAASTGELEKKLAQVLVALDKVQQPSNGACSCVRIVADLLLPVQHWRSSASLRTKRSRRKK